MLCSEPSWDARTERTWHACSVAVAALSDKDQVLRRAWAERKAHGGVSFFPNTQVSPAIARRSWSGVWYKARQIWTPSAVGNISLSLVIARGTPSREILLGYFGSSRGGSLDAR